MGSFRFIRIGVILSEIQGGSNTRLFKRLHIFAIRLLRPIDRLIDFVKIIYFKTNDRLRPINGSYSQFRSRISRHQYKHPNNPGPHFYPQ